MIIKYVITLNWGNLPNKRYDFKKGFNLIVGDAGSGKSTLLDGIQTVMSAAKHGWFNYNAGQGTDETKTKAKEYRSFASYLLGGDQGRFSRRSCEGLVACIFEDEDGGTFSAWIHGEAVLEGSGSEKRAKERGMHLGIVKNGSIELSDFLEDVLSAEEQTMREHAAAVRSLQGRFGHQNVETFSDKGSYLSRLYGAFKGKNNAGKAETYDAAKAFTRYIHPKEVSDVHRFVYDELLEKKDLTPVVRDLSEILQRSNRLKNEASAFERAQKSLAAIVSEGNSLLQRWYGLYEKRYIETKRTEQLHLRDAEKLERSIKDGKKQFEEASSRLDHVRSQRDETAKLINALEQQAGGNEELSRKKRLEEELSAQRAQLKKSLGRLNRTAAEIGNAASTLKLCSAYDRTGKAEKLHEKITELLSSDVVQRPDEVDEAELIALQSELSGICADIATQLDLDNEGSLAHAISEERLECATQLGEKSEIQQRLQQEAENIGSAGRIRYPDDVEEALELLEEHYPDAGARVLCEELDVLDAQWQSAIEGYLKQNRFAIIVEGTYEAQATRLLRDNRLRGAKVLQGQRLLNDLSAKGEYLKENSIVKLLRFHDPIVRAYFILTYGNVAQVHSAEALAKTPRGLTKDGMGSGSYATFACSLQNHECVIGKKAKADRLTHIMQRLEAMQEEIRPLSSKSGQLMGLQGRMQHAHVAYDPSDIDEIIALRTKASRIVEELDSIDVGEVAELIERIQQLQVRYRECEEEIEETSGKKGKLDEVLKRLQRNLQDEQGRLEKARVEREEAMEQLNRAASILQRSDASEPETLERRAVQTDAEEAVSFERDILPVCYRWKNRISEFNMHTLPATQVEFSDFEINDAEETLSMASGLLAAASALLHTVEHGLLFEKKKLLETANGEFKTVFVESFCTKVYDHIQSGINQLDSIGRTLRRNTFGEERFAISATRNPEFADYFSFFEEIAQRSSGGESLLTHMINQEDAESDIATELYEMLLESGGDERGIKKLLAIADYRNYHRYDIKKILNNDTKNAISLNKLATDSGGQAETSYYVIRSIAAYSAFGNDVLKKNIRALRFLCIDEGFSKVDEYRPEKILDFLVKDLGFQIITAMPTKNERVFLPFTSARHMVIKETVNSSHENFKVKVMVPYQELNREAVAQLQSRDKKQIELAFEDAAT